MSSLSVRCFLLFSIAMFCSARDPGSGSGGGVPRFCLDLLRSEDRTGTARALISCVQQVRRRTTAEGGRFSLGDGTYARVGRCIGHKVGLIDARGVVDKAALQRRILLSRKISEAERTRYLQMVDTCDTWDSCLRQQCRL